MHRARSLTINTSNACLVNKFNSLNSNSGGGARPYTPPPPSCRLHKIYEEKYEYLGALGYENWFDENANPFYRHAELELSAQDSSPFADTPSVSNVQDDTNKSSTKSQAVDSLDSLNKVVLLPAKPCQTSPYQKDDDSSSSDVTGYESLESDSDSDEGSDEIRSLFTGGYRFSLNDQMSNDNKENEKRHSPKSEIDSRRLSNRNRIMDRGRLMPDTTVFMALPMQNEHRFIMG
ncbi:hypothetical protein BGZ76_011803, partial [Entomortierella beljakovae]